MYGRTLGIAKQINRIIGDFVPLLYCSTLHVSAVTAPTLTAALCPACARTRAHTQSMLHNLEQARRYQPLFHLEFLLEEKLEVMYPNCVRIRDVHLRLIITTLGHIVLCLS